jgi:hypothetical protein
MFPRLAYYYVPTCVEPKSDEDYQKQYAYVLSFQVYPDRREPMAVIERPNGQINYMNATRLTFVSPTPLPENLPMP